MVASMIVPLRTQAPFASRSRAIASNEAAVEDGRLDPGLLARSRARIENLLARAPSNEIDLLPQDVFRAHADAAALYDAATVEVV